VGEETDIWYLKRRRDELREKGCLVFEEEGRREEKTREEKRREEKTREDMKRYEKI
jgi:hypothetical protein